MSHTHAARPAVFFWSLLSVFLVALLWVGVVPKVRAASQANAPNVIRLQVAGEWRSTLEKARDSALEEAQKQLSAKLRELAPPVDREPEVDDIRAKMVIKEYPTERTWDDIGTMTMVTLELELKPEHVRSLRQEERVIEAAWWMGGATLLLAVVGLFFRFEEWTKGFLTRWLVLGAAGVMALLAGLWWLIKS